MVITIREPDIDLWEFEFFFLKVYLNIIIDVVSSIGLLAVLRFELRVAYTWSFSL